MPRPNTAMRLAMILVNLVFMITPLLLLCWVGPVDDTGNEANEELGDSNDDEADEGVEDGVLGFLKLGGVAGGSDVADAADDDEDEGDDTGGADEPLKSISNDAIGVDTLD